MGKPRQTQSDKWNVRPVVVRSRRQSDDIRLAFNRPTLLDKFTGAVGLYWVAMFKGPERSWGTPHQVKPDKDNIDKLIMDALFSLDQFVAKGSHTKMWGPQDCLLIAIEGIIGA